MVSSPIVYLDQGLMVAGSGFKPFESVEVYIQLGHTQPSLGSAQADPGGAWVLQVGTLKTIRAIKIQSNNITNPPAVTLEAAGSEGSKASTPVIAMAEKPAPPAALELPPVGASIVVPGTVVPDGPFTIHGAGFGSEALVSVFLQYYGTESWDIGGARSALLGSVKASKIGTWSMDRTFVQFGPGLYAVKAFGVNGELAYAPLIVVEEK